jgi:hypothetical protein
VSVEDGLSDETLSEEAGAVIDSLSVAEDVTPTGAEITNEVTDDEVTSEVTAVTEEGEIVVEEKTA